MKRNNIYAKHPVLLPYLATIHKLHGRLPEEEVDVVLVLQRADEMRLIEVLEVILLCAQSVLNDEGISG